MKRICSAEIVELNHLIKVKSERHTRLQRTVLNAMVAEHP